MHKKNLRRGTMREYAAVFAIGAGGYCLLECLWRGHTHWTMGITGGACFGAIYKINQKYADKPVWKRAAAGAACITAAELAVGCVVNRALHMDVWDYSDCKYNVLGQICPAYSALWFGLCLPLAPLCGCLQKKLKNRYKSKLCGNTK